MAIADEEYFSVSFKVIVYVVSGLPFSALFICVILSMILHWDDATDTHCKVPNFFPSVSAAVASFSPEKYIWRLFVGLHGFPRLIAAVSYKNFLLTSPLRSYSNLRKFQILCNFACALNILEVIFLLLLTCVSSVENYGKFLYYNTILNNFKYNSRIPQNFLRRVRLLFCSLHDYGYNTLWSFRTTKDKHSGNFLKIKLPHLNHFFQGEKSYQYKIIFASGKITSLLLAMYFFYRHNTYCEPYIYSFFALSEYSVIVFNILFHSSAYYDFYGRRLTLSSGSSEYAFLPLTTEKKT